MESPIKSEIIQTRKAAALTQSQAAALVYVTTRNWQQWEGGERQMHPAIWELFNLKTGQPNTATAPA